MIPAAIADGGVDGDVVAPWALGAFLKAYFDGSVQSGRSGSRYAPRSLCGIQVAELGASRRRCSTESRPRVGDPF